MVEVKVCVGSSCHIRGGAKTLKLLKTYIEQYDLADNVDLVADLCLDNCVNAPNVVVDGTVHGGVTPDKAEEFFKENILAKVNADG
jgi:NADH:ubiquinone oxidoreductase subunit E